MGGKGRKGQEVVGSDGWTRKVNYRQKSSSGSKGSYGRYSVSLCCGAWSYDCFDTGGCYKCKLPWGKAQAEAVKARGSGRTSTEVVAAEVTSQAPEGPKLYEIRLTMEDIRKLQAGEAGALESLRHDLEEQVKEPEPTPVPAAETPDAAALAKKVRATQIAFNQAEAKQQSAIARTKKIQKDLLEAQEHEKDLLDEVAKARLAANEAAAEQTKLSQEHEAEHRKRMSPASCQPAEDAAPRQTAGLVEKAPEPEDTGIRATVAVMRAKATAYTSKALAKAGAMGAKRAKSDKGSTSSHEEADKKAANIKKKADAIDEMVNKLTLELEDLSKEAGEEEEDDMLLG